jgi:hypothetical protein
VNPWQDTQQVRYILRAHTWPEAGGQKVFGSVYISPLPLALLYNICSMPCCIIRAKPDKSDSQLPDYFDFPMELEYAVQVAGDPRMENAVVGANRVSGAAGSSGKGIQELSEVLSTAVGKLTESSGIKIVGRQDAEEDILPLEQTGYVVSRKMRLLFRCAKARYYHPPVRVVAIVAGANVTFTWADPPDRFDRTAVSRIRIRRAAGAVAPATVTDGAQVADVLIGVQTYVDAPGAGAWSYSLFAGYDEYGLGAIGRWSEGTATEEGIKATVNV